MYMSTWNVWPIGSVPAANWKVFALSARFAYRLTVVCGLYSALYVSDPVTAWPDVSVPTVCGATMYGTPAP